MINKERLSEILLMYKNDFKEYIWKDEKYKWEAVKHFQNNWDINAENFEEMLKRSLAKTKNLLTSQNYFARKMIIDFSRIDPITVRNMFKNLFNEKIQLEKRIKLFMEKAKELITKYNASEHRSDYQDFRAISTYLWLKYPDKYYIYKYTEFKAVIEILEGDYVQKRNLSIKNILDGYKMYDEICECLQQDSELYNILNSVIDEKCYNDSMLKTMTIDFGFYISRNIYNQNKARRITNVIEEKIYYNEKQRPFWGIRILNIERFNLQKLINNNMIAIHKDNPIRNIELDIETFVNNIRCGDEFCLFNGDKIGIIGEVIGETQNASFLSDEWICRKVKIKCNLLLCELNMSYVLNYSNICYMFNESQYNALIKCLENKYSVTLNSENEIYTNSTFLNEVYTTEFELEKMKSLLKNKKNIILQGAPGVGKTFAAKRLAYALMGEKDNDRIRMVQFHQSYSYEDFIEGYRPNKSGGFDLRDGVFKQFCNSAAEDTSRDYFFIIDEINRGNLSKIFGELLMLIEADKRGDDYSVNLVYSGDKLRLPENLYIIGMMNTADRSLAMIDYALRRRFAFYTMVPAFDDKTFENKYSSVKCELFHKAKDAIKNLNEVISKDRSLGKGFEIGHSYFCVDNPCDISDIFVKNIIEYEIIPTIEEYWFDNENVLSTERKKLEALLNYGEENETV